MTGIAEQIELGWHDAWVHEHRDAHGRWTVSFGPGQIGDYIHPSESAKTKALAEVQKDLDIQARTIPGIAEHQRVTIVNHVPDAPPDVEALAETMPDNEIFMTPSVIAAIGGAEHTRNKEKEQVGMGWWTPIDEKYNAADHVVSHEMGHVVGAHLLKDNPRMMTDPGYWGPIAKAIGIMPPRTTKAGKITNAGLSKWASDNQYALEKSVSQYGVASPWEMQAEMWAEFTMSSHPRPAAKAFGEYALAHLPAADLPAKAAP